MTQVQYDFSDRTVVITGGARGQGLSHALALARAGAKVAVLDIGHDLSDIPYGLSGPDDLDDARRRLEEVGADVLVLTCDVRIEDEVRAAFAEIRERLGEVDVLVNNAGVTTITPTQSMPLTEWQQVVDVCLTGAFLCSREVIPSMQAMHRGWIVNIASGAGTVGMPEQAHYTAAKHGIIGLTKALALELGPHAVRVNALTPTVVDSPLSDALGRLYPTSLDSLGTLYGTFHPLDGCVTLDVSDVTAAVCWLISAESRFVTGTVLPIDAGFGCK